MIGSVIRRLLLALAVLGATAGAALAAAPTASTGGLSRLSPIGATLTGTVNPNGEATTYVFEYGLSISYGATAPTNGPGNAGSGTTDTTARAAITGLQPGMVYHYRLTATNSSSPPRSTRCRCPAPRRAPPPRSAPRTSR
jgi:hypothetical protein